MPSPLDQFFRVPDAVPPKPVKPIDHYLKVTPSSSDNSRVHIPDQRAPVKTAGQLIYESMPHQMEIDREPSVLEAILPRASRSSSDAPISGMANLALDVGGLAGRAIMSAKKPDGESYLHALARSEGTYDKGTAGGRVANTLEAMGRDPFNVLMAPVEMMMTKSAGIASKLYRPGSVLEEKVAMKSGFVPPSNPEYNEIRKYGLEPHPMVPLVDPPEYSGYQHKVGDPIANRLTPEYAEATKGLANGGKPFEAMRGVKLSPTDVPNPYSTIGNGVFNTGDTFASGANTADDIAKAWDYAEGRDITDVRREILHAIESGNLSPEVRRRMINARANSLLNEGVSPHNSMYRQAIEDGVIKKPNALIHNLLLFSKNPKYVNMRGANIADMVDNTNYYAHEDMLRDIAETGKHDLIVIDNVRDPATGGHYSVFPAANNPSRVYYVPEGSTHIIKDKNNLGFWNTTPGNNNHMNSFLPIAGATGGLIGAANSRQSGN